MKLAEQRQEIDRIDAEIVRLLNLRAKTAREIGILKARANLPIADEEREREILRNVLLAGSGGHFGDDALIEIFRKILRESRELQARAMGEKNLTRGIY